VEVQEQRPVAKWQEKSWLSPQGEVLVLPHSGGLKVMPKLNGPDGMAPTVLSRFRQWNQLLNGVGLALNALSRTAVGTWNLNVSSFQIGAEQDRDFELTVSEVEADFRLGRFIRLYSQNNEEGWRQQIRRIDLRYPNGMAVALNQPLKPSTTE
jgi:cell division protein FtsQ